MALFFRAISYFVKPGAIVTDVGSVKGSVVRDLQQHLPESVELVPGDGHNQVGDHLPQQRGPLGALRHVPRSQSDTWVRRGLGVRAPVAL